MFGWLYKRLIDGMIPLALENIMDWIDSKEGQEYIAELTDTIADRQVSRIQSAIGGTLKGSKSSSPFNTGNIWEAVIQMILNKNMGQQQQLNSSVPNELPYRT